MGIFVPCCTPAEVAAHGQPTSGHKTAKGQQHVVFDYMTDLHPRFQAHTNSDYYTEDARVWLYPLLDVDAADVHAACLEVAQARPTNHWWFRLSAVCWCWPWQCCATPNRIAPSTCVALTLRIIARARSGSPSAYKSDRFVFEELGVERCSCSAPFAPRVLTGHTPRSGMEALRGAGVVGSPLEGFEAAIAACKGAGKAPPIGDALPLLPLLSLMSRA